MSSNALKTKAAAREPGKSALAGHRIRARRQELNLTQAGLAATVGVSPSYLNLIEHNRRTIGGTLLLRIAKALDTSPEALSGREEARLAAEFAEVIADPALKSVAIPAERLSELVGAAPELARAALTTFRAYRDAREQAEALAERLAQDPFLAEASHQLLTLITSIRSFSEILQDYGDMDDVQRGRFINAIAEESSKLTGLSREMFDFLGGRAARRPHQTPEEEVDDLIHDHNNHFPTLEAAADARRARLDADLDARGASLFAALTGHLKRTHGVSVRFVPPEELSVRDYRYDPEDRALYLSEALPNASWRFQAARVIGELEAGDEIADIIASPLLSTDEARARARSALLSAYAGALILPHDTFLAAARADRYDIERLQHRFSASFEQVCHRLASLHRPGGDAENAPVPFHFLRTDVAGNISKRFSASGLRLPRYTGACPRWVSHTAFLTPERIVTQVAQLPNGATYLFIAKAFTRPAGGWAEPRTHHCVTLGCDIAFARHLVYGDGLDPTAHAVPVGVSCRQCPRDDCRQRTLPAIDPRDG